jgi:hypothetical protein
MSVLVPYFVTKDILPKLPYDMYHLASLCGYGQVRGDIIIADTLIFCDRVTKSKLWMICSSDEIAYDGDIMHQ